MTTQFAGDVTYPGQTGVLNASWLDTNSSCNYVYTPGITYTPTYTYTGPTNRIRLTMTEVERLRTRAKKDKQLRDILAKFTDSIEVTIDFGEDK